MQMMQKQATFLHPILFAAYPTVALLANNIEEIKIAVALRALVISIVAGILLFLSLRALLKDQIAAAISTSLVLILFFSYGHVYRYLEMASFSGISLGRHRFLLPLTFILLLILTYWIMRYKGRLSGVNTLLNWVAIITLVQPVINIARYELYSARTLTRIDEQSDSVNTLRLPGVGTPPDIYYIIVDAYARDDTLLEDYHLDNTPFLNQLEDMGFFIARCSQSNYSQTQLSLSSSLNMNYLQEIGEQFSPGNTSRVEVQDLIQNNRVRRAFEDLGYLTVAFETGFKGTQWEDADMYFLPATGIFENMNIAGGLSDFEVMLLNTSAGLIVTDAARILPEFLQAELDNPRLVHRQRVLFTFEKLHQLSEMPGPKFVFAHLVIPHPPYVFGADGEFTDYDLEADIGYPNQIIYLNGQLLSLVKHGSLGIAVTGGRCGGVFRAEARKTPPQIHLTTASPREPKTQILRLEPHDDFISARDKMGWSKAGRILLVWPEGSHILYRRLDLTLLQRHSAFLGAQLAVVSNDTDVCYHAKKLDIPVYRTIQSAQKSHWRTHRWGILQQTISRSLDHPRPDLQALALTARPQASKFLAQPVTRLVLFTLGVIALLSIAAVLVPEATIVLTPETRSQELVLNVRARPGIDTVSISGDIPTRLVTAEVEGRSSLPSSGTTRIPEDYAKGQVRFTNLTDRSITIPAQTVVRTPDNPAVRFATLTTANIFPGVGQTITVTVQAIEPGTTGNLSPNRLIAIEGELGASLSSTNPQATRGGSERSLSIATQRNREQLFEQLIDDLSNTVQDELLRQLTAGDILFTPTITVAHVVEQIYEPPDELPSDQLGLNLRVEYQALAAAQIDLQQLAEYALDANLPKMFQAVPDTIVIENITSPVIKEDRTAEWKIRARRELRAVIQESEAVSLSLGISPDLAAKKLAAELPITSQPRIQLNPSWWPRLPILPFRYIITIQQ
jgi:hypothetical protein